MNLIRMLGFSVLLATLVAAQQPPDSRPFPPEQMPKLTLGFDIHAMDTTADPCNNFYQYACGTWLKENDIPADKTSWGRFNELDERNRAVLHGILEKAAKDDPKRTAIEQKTGDYYSACMDEKAIEEKGLAPIKPELDRIAT